MSRVATLIALAAALLLHACTNETDVATRADPKVVNTKPQLAASFVTRPLFKTQQGEFEAGTAFAVRIEGVERTVVLTALHLFGPAGGLDADIAPDKIADVLQHAELHDAFDFTSLGITEGVIPLPDASPMNERPGAGDIVALWAAKGITAGTAPLGLANPRPGDVVWLAADVNTDDSDRNLHRATVVGMEGSLLMYRFDDIGITLTATSGAPVLNTSGEVIAINAAGGQNGGVMFGVGNPVENFRPALLRAINTP